MVHHFSTLDRNIMGLLFKSLVQEHLLTQNILLHLLCKTIKTLKWLAQNYNSITFTVQANKKLTEYLHANASGCVAVDKDPQNACYILLVQSTSIHSLPSKNFTIEDGRELIFAPVQTE